MNDKIIDLLKNSYESFLEELKKADWNTLTDKYKNFLKEIPLSEYREKLQKVKTVEFDLSGKYRSFHLSLIYHLYWKQKYISLINSDVPSRYRKIKQLCDYLSDNKGKVALYKILGNFGFATEEKFITWLYFTKYSNNISPQNFLNIEQNTLSKDTQFFSFEEFWSEYKNNINLDDFIRQHQSFINVDSIKSQLKDETKNDSTIFNVLQKEDIDTEKTGDIIKGYILVGLKARMYRTWVSLLTQLDLGYTWNQIIENHKLDSDVIADVKGIDLYGKIDNSFIGIQIKKRSRRHEALKIIESETPIRTIDVPYDLNFEEDNYLCDKLTKFKNNFVVFNDKYVRHIYKHIRQGSINGHA